MTAFLAVEDLLRIAAHATGAQPLVRDFGLLESAAARPQTIVFGAEAYPDLWAKAAALGHSLIANHAWWTATHGLAGWRCVRS